MTKKQDELGFAPLALSTPSSMVPYSLQRSYSQLTKTEQQIVAEKDKQLLVISGNIQKAQVAIHGIGMMHRTAQSELFETAQHVGALNAAASGMSYQSYVQQFNHHDIQLQAQHTYAIEDSVAYSLRVEMDRTLYRADEPKKRGFFSR